MPPLRPAPAMMLAAVVAHLHMQQIAARRRFRVDTLIVDRTFRIELQRFSHIVLVSAPAPAGAFRRLWCRHQSTRNAATASRSCVLGSCPGRATADSWRSQLLQETDVTHAVPRCVCHLVQPLPIGVSPQFGQGDGSKRGSDTQLRGHFDCGAVDQKSQAVQKCPLTPTPHEPPATAERPRRPHGCPSPANRPPCPALTATHWPALRPPGLRRSRRRAM